MVKIRKAAMLVLILLLTLTACGSSGLKMSLEQIGEAVVYNRSMVGAGTLISENVRNTISFDNSDPAKMKYITNNLYTEGYTTEEDIQIVKGLYYDAYTGSGEDLDMRGVICFLQFENEEQAKEAAKRVPSMLNQGADAPKGYQLPSSAVSVRQNVICIIATQEPNPCMELKRVFEDSTYVK